MYIQLKDFISYMSAENKDLALYFCSVIFLCNSAKKREKKQQQKK